MDDAVIANLLQQLAYQSPLLLVYLIGLLLAFVTYRRHPSASLLVIVGTAFLILATAAFAFLQAYLFQQHREQGWPAERLARMLSLVGIASGISRAIGLALIVAAVFVGRRRLKQVEVTND